MKIGYVLDDRLDKPDGVQQYVKQVSAWMLAHGHEVHFLVGDSPEASQQNVHHLSKTVNVTFNGNKMGIPLPASKKKIAALLAREQFDVLHVQMPYSPVLAGRVVSGAGLRTAVVGTFHVLPNGTLPQYGTRLLSAVLRRNKKRFDAFFSVSPAAQIFAKSHFGITSVVSPNVVQLTEFQQGRPLKQYADKLNIVFLGRLVERKGAPYLLKAYDRLLADQPKLAKTTRLLICGRGPEMAQLQAAAAQITQKTGAEIIFTGFLEEAQKKDYLASARAAVYPSTSGESFGIVLIEAMAARAQVVLAGNNPGYASVMADCPETLFDPRSITDFAALLSRCITDEKFVKTIYPKQQQLVQRFDIQAVGPQLIDLYQAALAKREHKRDTSKA